MTDQQSLFPAPEGDEKTWTRAFEIGGGQRVDFPLYESLIRNEIRDQVGLKSSVRKAALRSSQKSIQRMGKMGVAKLSAHQLEELKWSLFICHVDAAIAGNHLKLREDEAGQAALTTNPAFAAT